MFTEKKLRHIKYFITDTERSIQYNEYRASSPVGEKTGGM
jgi:hypothetical protein